MDKKVKIRSEGDTEKILLRQKYLFHIIFPTHPSSLIVQLVKNPPAMLETPV